MWLNQACAFIRNKLHLALALPVHGSTTDMRVLVFHPDADLVHARRERDRQLVS